MVPLTKKYKQELEKKLLLTLRGRNSLLTRNCGS